MGANAQQTIEDVINMIGTGEVQGTDTPVFVDDIAEDGVPVDPASDITEDGIVDVDPGMSAAPTGAPAPVPPKPINCIDRSLEVSYSTRS